MAIVKQELPAFTVVEHEYPTIKIQLCLLFWKNCFPLEKPSKRKSYLSQILSKIATVHLGYYQDRY